MNFDFKYKKRKFIYTILGLIGSLLAILYIYSSIVPAIEEKIEKKIIYNSTIDVINAIKNTIRMNLPKEDFIKKVLKDNNYRKSLSKALSVFLSDRLEYIFLIFRDRGKYRYLLDISKNNDKLYPGFLFVPLYDEEKVLEKVIKEKNEQVVIHKDINTIGITYYLPIIQENKVKSVLIADFSFETLGEIKNLMSFIKEILLAAGITIVGLILFSGYSFYRNVLLKEKIFIDSLTGVYNRSYLENLYNSLNLNDYVILLLDVDYFKNINDTYGHQVGDEILKNVSEILKESLRGEDYIIRYGGEEFLILLKKSEEDKEGKWALHVAEKLLQKIRTHKYKNIKITASIGINLNAAEARNLTDAIKKADIALYKAKNSGRDRLEIYSLHEEKGNITLAELKEVLESNKIECWYQPIINMKTGEPLYFEALARIYHQGEYLVPARFIDLIKGTFMYAKFTKAIIEYNIKILQENPQLKVSINMSPSDFVNETTIELLLSANKDIVRRLKLEVLETEEIHNYKSLKTNINKLVEAGYQIVLDDFGAGYVDFYYITDIDAKYLKLDGSMIRQLTDNERYYKLTKHLVSFCKDMDKTPIAEFVENKKILDILLELGIEYGQGYYFSRPIPIEEVIKKYFS
ncbi:bifunctional diguanylate cyclase/phosphodiesterase [Persephonella sp. IF05-L8]|uniref:EAL domain-containing protein n=1 Tax=Persephonella sp. IF05-L8 TaxID=1158338 RepID=UPI0004970384